MPSRTWRFFLVSLFLRCRAFHLACPRRGCAERGRGRSRRRRSRLPALAHRQERGARRRTRLRAFGTAAYRHLRRGRAPRWCATPSACSPATRSNNSNPDRLLGRHGRLWKPPDNAPSPPSSSRPPRQAAVRGAGSVWDARRASARTTTRRAACLRRLRLRSRSPVGDRANHRLRACFDATLLTVLERYDAATAINCCCRCARSASRPTRPSCLCIRALARSTQVPIDEVRPDAGTIVWRDPGPASASRCCRRRARQAVGGSRTRRCAGSRCVDYEMAGKDLIDSVSSRARSCGRSAASRRRGSTTSSFSTKRAGKSEVKGNGLTIEGWLAYGTPEVCRC